MSLKWIFARYKFQRLQYKATSRTTRYIILYRWRECKQPQQTIVGSSTDHLRLLQYPPPFFFSHTLAQSIIPLVHISVCSAYSAILSGMYHNIIPSRVLLWQQHTRWLDDNKCERHTPSYSCASRGANAIFNVLWVMHHLPPSERIKRMNLLRARCLIIGLPFVKLSALDGAEGVTPLALSTFYALFLMSQFIQGILHSFFFVCTNEMNCYSYFLGRIFYFHLQNFTFY